MKAVAAAIIEETKEAPETPNGWRLVQLRELIEEAQGGFASGERDAEGVIQLRMNNVTTDGGFDWSSFLRVPADAETIERYKLRPGDVLFNNTNSTELVGKSVYFEAHEEPVVFSNHFTRLRVKRDALDPLFLAHWLRGEWGKGTFARICNRWIGQSAVQRDKLLDLPIPIPSLAEQRRIAAKLREKMEALTRAKKAAEERAAIVGRLLDIALCEQFESDEAKGWPRVKLGSVALKVGSGLTPLGGKAAYQNTGIPLIRSQNVLMNRFSDIGLARISAEQDAEMSGSRVQADDVLLNITGASIGRVCVVPSEICPANVNQHVSIIRLNGSMLPYFLSFFLASPTFQKFIMGEQAGATRQALTKSQIEDFAIPLPSVSEQTAVVERISRQNKTINRIKEATVSEADAIAKLPGALLRQSFSGGL